MSAAVLWLVAIHILGHIIVAAVAVIGWLIGRRWKPEWFCQCGTKLWGGDK